MRWLATAVEVAVGDSVADEAVAVVGSVEDEAEVEGGTPVLIRLPLVAVAVGKRK